MSDETIRYGFPKISKNGERVGFKTYTTAVYNPDGSTLEDRLNNMPGSDGSFRELKLNTSLGVNILEVRFNAQGNISNTGTYTIDNNGNSDCTAKLQKIINKYQHIYIPDGQYKISELKLDSGTIIEGKNPFNVIFRPNANTSHLFTIENKASIIIKNINIGGNNNVANEDAINIDGNCDNILIENVHIQNFIGDSIKIHTTGTSRVTNININNVEISIDGNALYNRANSINNRVFATGINISISDFRSVINITGLACRLLQYDGSASSSSGFYAYLLHFYNDDTNRVINNNNNICLLPIIKAISSVYNNAAPYNDNIPCINISNSIFEGMSQSIYNKGIKLNISNSVFNAGILGDIFADTGSRIQLVGVSIMLLVKAVSNNGLVYYLRRDVLKQLYDITMYDENGHETSDPQPWGYIDVFDISTETSIYRHAFIYSLIIDEIRYFTTEKYSGTLFSSTHLIGPVTPRLYHGNITLSENDGT